MNYEPSIHGGLHEAPDPGPNNTPEIRGKLTRSVLERRNDYQQARARFMTMMDWEREDLVHNMGTLLGQCERDVQERMLWHFFLIHDAYGQGVAERLGMSAEDIRHLEPLPGQVLTDEDQRRRGNLGANGDGMDREVWGQWTSSVENHRATAEEVLGGTLPSARS